LKGTRPQRLWRELARFAGALALFALALFGVFYRSPRLYGALKPSELWTAQVTEALLLGLGMAVERSGTVLADPGGFRYEIYYRCTGWMVAAFLLVGLFALPGRPRSKLRAAALGVLVVLAVNLVRLVSLFYIGVHHPRAFGFTHAVLWEGIMILLAVLFWLPWMSRLASAPQGPRSSRSRGRSTAAARRPCGKA
jgi:exosortase/archaeosortase family protein